MRPSVFAIFFVALVSFSFAQNSQLEGMYSIVAWDSATGDVGVAVQSTLLAVGSIVPYAKAGVGAVATQGSANTGFGNRGLDLLLQGMPAQQVGDLLIRSDTLSSQRQLGVVDAKGNVFAYTGTSCQQYAGHNSGKGYTVQGNALGGENVLKAMARTFEITSGDLADRLLATLDAADRESKEKNGFQSAALLVVRDHGGYNGYTDRFIDIRVDNDTLPLKQLKRIYGLWKATFLPDARMRTIDQFNNDKNFSAARIEMERLVESMNGELRNKPDDPNVLSSIAWSLATLGIDKPRALELAKRAAILAPARSDILNTLAECHYRLGNYDEAIAIESNLVAKEPANDQFWKQLEKFKESKQGGGIK